MVKDEIKKAQQSRDTEYLREIRKESPEIIRLIPLFSRTDQRLKELRSEKRKLYERYEASQKGFGPVKYGGDERIMERIERNNEIQRSLKINTLKQYQSAIDDKM